MNNPGGKIGANIKETIKDFKITAYL